MRLEKVVNFISSGGLAIYILERSRISEWAMNHQHFMAGKLYGEWAKNISQNISILERPIWDLAVGGLTGYFVSTLIEKYRKIN